MRKSQRGTGEHYIETQVENKVGEGGRGGREQEEEPPRPAPPYPIPPNSSLPKKLWETGQVRMNGMSVKARCGTTRGHHTYSDERWATPTLMAMEEDLVLMGLWVTDGSAVSPWKAATYTPE